MKNLTDLIYDMGCKYIENHTEPKDASRMKERKENIEKAKFKLAFSLVETEFSLRILSAGAFLIGGMICGGKLHTKSVEKKLQPNYVSIHKINDAEYKDLDGKPGNETYMNIGDKVYAVKDSCGIAKLVLYNK